MAEDIKYTLGLVTAGFLSPLRGAIGALAGLAGIATVVSTALRGTWQAIETGGKLQDLSARTSVAVKDLYQLQTAFGQVGLEGEGVGLMVLRLQRAMGETASKATKGSTVWQQMGVDFQQLRRMGAADQMRTIAEALGKMDRSQAAAAASKIFGREGFGHIMTIAGDLQGFTDGLNASAQAALIFGRNAAIFDRIGDTISLIKMRIQGMWAGFAEGVAPGIDAIVQALNGINFTGFGERIGGFLLAIGQAIKNGQFGELFSLSIMVGIERIQIAWVELVKFMGATLTGVLGNPAFWQGIVQVMGASFSGAASSGFGLLEKVLPAGSKATQGRENFGGMANDLAVAGTLNLTKGITEAKNNFDKALKDLNIAQPTFLSGLLKTTFEGLTNQARALMLPGGQLPPGNLAAPIATGKRPEEKVDELTRIGAIFGGGASLGMQYSAQTAQATRRTVDLLQVIHQAIIKQSLAATSFAHL